MCDTACVVRPGRVLFLKSSDRDANEPQILEWHPRRSYRSKSTVTCTWIEIPQAQETHAVLLSRPTPIWGAEMGTNEHGVTIGNEAVFTKTRPPETGLTGMDLLRLALERSRTAAEAIEVIVTLAERHGQGGRCGFEDPSFRYYSSFLIADPTGAFVLETAEGGHATERVEGARSISNLLTIDGFAGMHSDRVRTAAAAGASRRRQTEEAARDAETALDMIRIARSHGRAAHPVYSAFNGTLSVPCMHGGGMIASAVTTGSWVSELSTEACRHWATGTSAPCMSLYKPVEVGSPVDVDELWWRHERLHREVLRNPDRLMATFEGERDAVEAAWHASPPASHEAFVEADRLLEAWTQRTERTEAPEVRPIWARRYWAKREATSPSSRTRERRAGPLRPRPTE